MTAHHQFAALRPAGGFRVILADPPWKFAAYSEAGEAKNPSQHYNTMAGEDIKRLPVEALAAKDCALFLWVTWPNMPLWLPTIEAWGFEFSGLAWEWIKYNEETGKYAFGTGYGTRKNLEPCLLATRGFPQLRKHSVSGLFGPALSPMSRSVRDFILHDPHEALRAPKREHSRKPDEQYDRIETMFEGPYVELFARNTRQGWSSWGNEIEKFAESETKEPRRERVDSASTGL